MSLAHAPVSWLTALVRDSEYCHGTAQNFVKDRVGKVTKNMSPDRILVFGPHQRVDTKAINRLKRLGSKSLGCDRAALEVPKEKASLISASASGRISTPKRVTERSVVLWLPSKKRP